MTNVSPVSFTTKRNAVLFGFLLLAGAAYSTGFSLMGTASSDAWNAIQSELSAAGCSTIAQLNPDLTYIDPLDDSSAHWFDDSRSNSYYALHENRNLTVHNATLTSTRTVFTFPTTDYWDAITDARENGRNAAVQAAAGVSDWRDLCPSSAEPGTGPQCELRTGILEHEPVLIFDPSTQLNTHYFRDAKTGARYAFMSDGQLKNGSEIHAVLPPIWWGAVRNAASSAGYNEDGDTMKAEAARQIMLWKDCYGDLRIHGYGHNLTSKYSAHLAEAAMHLDNILHLEELPETSIPSGETMNKQWMLGSESLSNGNHALYYIEENGLVSRYKEYSSDEIVGMLDASYYINPENLYDAGSNSSVCDLDWRYEWEASDVGEQFDSGGWDEKWFMGNNKDYFITPNGAIYQFTTGSFENSKVIATVDPWYYEDLSRIVAAWDEQTYTCADGKPAEESGSDGGDDEGEAGGTGEGETQNALIELYQTHLFTSSGDGNHYHNWGGSGEKWISSASGLWYFILPTGELYRWLGKNLNLDDNTKIADVGTLAYVEPERLFDPYAYTDEEEGERSDPDVLLQLDSQYLFKYSGSSTHYLNWGGIQEKWIVTNTNAWYFITRDGFLYQWDGGSLTTEEGAIASVGTDVYDDPSLLYDAVAHASAGNSSSSEASSEASEEEDNEDYEGLSVEQIVEKLQKDFNIERTDNANHYFNWGGQNEKWVIGKVDGANTWFYVLPNGDFYRWDGGALENSTKIVSLDVSYYTNFEKVYGGDDEDNTEIEKDCSKIAFVNYYDWGGLQEYWFRDGSIAAWYYILEDDPKIYKWKGGDVSNADIESTMDSDVHWGAVHAAADGSKEAASTPVIDWLCFGGESSESSSSESTAESSSSSNTSSVSSASICTKSETLVEADATLTYTPIPVGWGGEDEYWFTDHVASPNVYYNFRPNGGLYRWAGDTLDKDTLVNLFPISFYNEMHEAENKEEGAASVINWRDCDPIE